MRFRIFKVSFSILLSIFVYVLNGYTLPDEDMLAPIKKFMEKIQQEREEQLIAIRSIKKVHIMVGQSYGKDTFSLPFESMTRKLLGKYTPLQIVDKMAIYNTATLRIQAEGEAMGATYTDGEYRKTGASLYGTISLEIPGVPIYKKHFNGKVEPFGIINVTYYKSSDPFNVSFTASGSFISKMLEIINEVYGINTLITALKDEDEDIRRLAAVALGETKDSRAVEPLITSLRDIVRKEAAVALGKIKDSRSVEPLIIALTAWDSDFAIEERKKAVWALGEIKDTRAIEPLIAVLINDKHEVSEYAADAIEKIGVSAVEPLIAVLMDKNLLYRSRVAELLGRKKAAELLGRLKDARAVEPLIAALKDEDSLLQKAAVEALRKITKQYFGRDPIKWQEWWTQNKDSR
ncbi:MAG: HEAT repeat domain-containing protein [Nitrospirota bacterium]